MTVDPLVAELRDRREKAGLTQRQLADAMHCVQSHVSMLEAGRTDLQLDTLRRWAAALGVQPAWVPLTYEPASEDVARTLDVAERTVEKAREARADA